MKDEARSFLFLLPPSSFLFPRWVARFPKGWGYRTPVWNGTLRSPFRSSRCSIFLTREMTKRPAGHA